MLRLSRARAGDGRREERCRRCSRCLHRCRHCAAAESATTKAPSVGARHGAARRCVAHRQRRRLPPDARHYYEVIREGHACRLYFDLEYRRASNPTHDGNAMVATWLACVFHALSVQFGALRCTRRHVVDLDSSTEDKFSRHLIVHTPSAVFRSNADVGCFVHGLLDALRRWQARGCPDDPAQVHDFAPTVSAAALAQLFVRNEHGDTVLFVDDG